MRKLLSMMLCLCLCLCILASCATTGSAGTYAKKAKITMKTYPVYAFKTSEAWKEAFPIYFVDGVEDLPFIELSDFRDFMVDIFHKDDLSDGEIAYDLALNVIKEGKEVALTRETEFFMDVDFENGKITFLDFVAFNQMPNAGYMEINGFPETKNGKPFLLRRTQDRNLYGDLSVVDLKKYGIPMYVQDGKYLLPMQTLFGFTLSDNSVGVYFNGQAIYVNAISVMTNPVRALEVNLQLSGLLTADLIQKMMSFEGPKEDRLNYLLELVSQGSDKGKEIVEQYKADLDSNMYNKYASASKAPRSFELIKYGFNELAMELDYLYGLKEIHNITDFRTFFLQNEVGIGLADPDAAKADQALTDLTLLWFDDGHSSIVSASYLSESDPATVYGFGISARQNLSTNLSALRSQFPGSSLPYYEVGDTAYVCFDSFSATSDDKGTVDYYKLAEEGNMPIDTIGIIYEAHRQITRENSPIRNVVLDLSNNGGGVASTAFYVLGWFLGEANYSYRNTFSGAQTTHYFRADVNLDYEFDENDTLAGRDLNLYCLISPVSFSCGNLVPWVFKTDGSVTLLGKPSGGGSCVVGYNTTAWGASYQYSSNQQLSFTKNGSYYNVDQGVEPDFFINDYRHFYDREALTQFIHGLY